MFVSNLGSSKYHERISFVGKGRTSFARNGIVMVERMGRSERGTVKRRGNERQNWRLEEAQDARALAVLCEEHKDRQTKLDEQDEHQPFSEKRFGFGSVIQAGAVKQFMAEGLAEEEGVGGTRVHLMRFKNSKWPSSVAVILKKDQITDKLVVTT